MTHQEGTKVKADGQGNILFSILPSVRVITVVEMERKKEIKEIVKEEIPVKMPTGFHVEINKQNLKFIRK